MMNIAFGINLTYLFFKLYRHISVNNRRPQTHLNFVDHVVGNQPDKQMEPVAKWYANVSTLERVNTFMLTRSHNSAHIPFHFR